MALCATIGPISHITQEEIDMAAGIRGQELVGRSLSGGERSNTSRRRLVIVGAALAVVATAADLIVATALRNALQVPIGFSPLTVPSVATMTIAGMVGATVVFGWLTRVRPDPRAAFVRIALAALILSWLPDLGIWVTGVFPATTGAGILSLATLHVVAAACAVAILLRFGLGSE
jgi:Family of unknown function (DUF6069)